MTHYEAGLGSCTCPNPPAARGLREAALLVDEGWYSTEEGDEVRLRYASDLPARLNTLRAALATTAERLPTCSKCHATDIGVRWDKSHYDCLYREQQRRDWPHGDGEHLHYHCRTCGYSWASLVT